MSKTLTEIAQQLRDANKKVQLIYAFNGAGKTRLSRAFKDLIAPKNNDVDGEGDAPPLSREKILYYNAFTEDLFYWDNDLKLDVAPRLKIQPNTFTDWVLKVLKDLGQDRNIVANFQRYTDEKLTPRFNEEYTVEDADKRSTVKAFSEITFSYERGDEQRSSALKISKGEESSFIWNVFYTLLEQVITVRNVVEPDDRETNEFDGLEYVFIDDPVSSLDENNLIQLAVNLAQLMSSSTSGVKFVVCTHSALFYNVLYNEIKAKSGFILSRFSENDTFVLDEKKGDSNRSFSYHLHIKKLIQHAIDSNSVQRYHFALLRNLYEKTAAFLGYREWSDLLPEDKKAYSSRIMNFYPHNTLSNEEIAEPTDPEKQMVGLLIRNLDQYGYWQEPEQQNG